MLFLANAKNNDYFCISIINVRFIEKQNFKTKYDNEKDQT